jgi:hypothetical protein
MVDEKPTPDVEVLGEWDHGMNDPNEKHVDTSLKVSAKQAILEAERAVDSVVRRAIQKGATALRVDEHAKAEAKEHTVEEVAGLKMCVNEVIHKDSFLDP